MAYQKIYSREHWENFPSEKTAINRDRLNNIEGGIDAIDDRVCALDTTKVDLTKANELVKEILWDESNGTLTVVKMNGSRAVIDTKLEKLAVNFTYNPQTQQLVITLDDGTVQNVDLSALITEYEFLDSDTIAFEIVDGKVKAIVKNGSITENHLAPEYLAEIRTQVGKAEMSAKSADASEKNAVSSSTLAKSYAVGGTGTRDGEDTDNARYYMEQAKAVSAVDIATTEKAGIVKPDGTTITADEDGTLHGVAKITVDTALSSTSTNPVQNKVVTSNLIDIRKETTVNLLNPILQTTTQNGVTCTNNGDGTYTFNGTATSTVFFDINKNISINKGTKYKVVCFKDEDYIPNKIVSCVRRVDTKDEYVFGNGSFVPDTENCWLWVSIAKNVTVSNLVAKPTITTNLNATYDDFVPYTGDTGRLNGDVAELQDSKADKTEVPKLVKVDGKTVFLSEDGVLSAKGGGATITPKPTVNPQIKNDDKKVVITWEDPTDTVIEGSTFSKWAGTKLVMKESGYPTSPDDGTVLVDNTTRDKYKTTGFTKDGLTNDKQYYFALFPYSTDGVYNYDSGNRLLGEPTELKIVTFAGGTDAEIAKMIQAHYNNKINIADYWAVGDTRSVSLSAMSATGVGESHRAQTVQLVILDFEHDDLATAINGHSKAAVSIGLKDCLMDASNALNPVNGGGNTENGYMNSSATNAGGWKNCARRAWCNNVFFAALPSTWQSMVKIVNKKSGTGGGSSSGTEITADKIFLAAEIEIFGSTNNSFNGEGTQYQYYKNATANKYKMPKWSSSGVSHIYWERSPRSGNSTVFCIVYDNGNASYDSANDADGVAPCLCI